MAPQRFSSVRHKPRPAVRLAWDDSGLIAVRYEQTKQAEPPIPLPPPRNPLRTATTATTTITTRRLSTTGSVRPITIVPPPVAPPQEEHPLFRVQQPSPGTRADEWKRDSGLARSSSSATLREEDEEDVVYQKILDDIADAPSDYSGDEQQSPTSDPPSPIFDHPDPTPAPLNLRSVPQSPVSPISPAESPLESLPLPSPTPTRASSLTSKLGLGKAFSIRSAGKRRLRKKTRSVIGLVKDMDRVMSPNAGASPNVQRPNSPPRSARPSAEAAKDNEAARQSQAVDSDFTPITTSIPEESLWDDFNTLSFSKRGSLMFGGKSDPLSLFSMAYCGDSSITPLRELPETAAATPTVPAATGTADPAATPGAGSEAATATSPAAIPSDAVTNNKPGAPNLDESPSVPSIRVVSMDVERESQKRHSFIRHSTSKRPVCHSIIASYYASSGQFLLTSTR